MPRIFCYDRNMPFERNSKNAVDDEKENPGKLGLLQIDHQRSFHGAFGSAGCEAGSDACARRAR